MSISQVANGDWQCHLLSKATTKFSRFGSLEDQFTKDLSQHVPHLHWPVSRRQPPNNRFAVLQRSGSLTYGLDTSAHPFLGDGFAWAYGQHQLDVEYMLLGPMALEATERPVLQTNLERSHPFESGTSG